MAFRSYKGLLSNQAVCEISVPRWSLANKKGKLSQQFAERRCYLSDLQIAKWPAHFLSTCGSIRPGDYLKYNTIKNLFQRSSYSEMKQIHHTSPWAPILFCAQPLHNLWRCIKIYKGLELQHIKTGMTGPHWHWSETILLFTSASVDLSLSAGFMVRFRFPGCH